ncbi:hypothetical protein LCGC14_1101890 [marine sediment metagenome]|uniref:Uncharacterized protein n=1 Tax=marine sediment metagenome TaxID=412755 RepID=A0A0F9M969_9ZZZZ
MKIGQTIYVATRPDGNIVSDCECEMISESKELLEEYLDESLMPGIVDLIESRNGCKISEIKIEKVKLVRE